MIKLSWTCLAILLMIGVSMAYIVAPTDEYPKGAEIHKISVVKGIDRSMDNPSMHRVSEITLIPLQESLHVEINLIPRYTSDVPGTKYHVTEIRFDHLVGTANITFQVENEWLNKNNLTADDVIIYFKDYEEWVEQDALLVEQDDSEYTYYKLVDTDNQGYFAISTAPVIIEEEPEAETEPIENNTTTDVNEDEESATATGLAIGDLTGWLIGSVVVLFLISIAGLGYFYYQNRGYKSAI